MPLRRGQPFEGGAVNLTPAGVAVLTRDQEPGAVATIRGFGSAEKRGEIV
jgi:hypothetical protein